MNPLLGVGFGLTVAVFWALSPIAHAAAGRRIGAFPTLLWRSVLASLLLIGTVLVAGSPFPRGDAAVTMSVSGLTGVGIGDVLIYEAFVTLGPRRSVQLLALGPVFAFLIAWLALGETVVPVALAGAALVLGASAAAVWIERRAVPTGAEPGRVTTRGVVCAIGGAALLGVGAVLARRAYLLDPGMDPLMGAAIRVLSASAMLWIWPLARGDVPRLVRLLADRVALNRILIGTLLGPYLGMLAYVAAFQHLEAGLVLTLVSLSPLVILPAVAWRYRSRIGTEVILAAAAAVAGVALISTR